MNATVQKFVKRLLVAVVFLSAVSLAPCPAFAAQAPAGAGQAVHEAGEANLVVPDLSTVDFRGWNGRGERREAGDPDCDQDHEHGKPSSICLFPQEIPPTGNCHCRNAQER